MRSMRLTTSLVASVASDRIGLITGLEAAWPGSMLVGPALTVRTSAGDNYAIHRALASAKKGIVIVVQLDGDVSAGHWGELMTIAAQVRGVAGLVIDGPIRDRAQIAERAFPAFHRGTDPFPAAKIAPGVIAEPVTIRGVPVAPGDLICGDGDGVVVIPQSIVGEVLAAAETRAGWEERAATELQDGRTTLEVLGRRLDE